LPGREGERERLFCRERRREGEGAEVLCRSTATQARCPVFGVSGYFALSPSV